MAAVTRFCFLILFAVVPAAGGSQSANAQSTPPGPGGDAKTPADVPAQTKPSLADYPNFWGINRNTTTDELRKRFGEPEGILDARWFYFGAQLSFFIKDDGTVGTMIIDDESSTLGSIVPGSADVEKASLPKEILEAAFIGQTAEAVVSAFSKPGSISSDNYEYDLPQNIYSEFGSVTFQCYDFNQFRCSQFWLSYGVPKE